MKIISFKGAKEILQEEQKKKPCSKFPNGSCHFGGTCRFSHYTPAQLVKLQKRGKQEIIFQLNLIFYFCLHF